MTPEEMLERMAKARFFARHRLEFEEGKEWDEWAWQIGKEIGKAEMQAALRELRKIHLGNRGTLMQAVLDITELKL